eukprot:472916-Pyramimonas_sp.AAC.1
MNVTKRACVPQTQGYMSALGDLSEDDSEDEDETATRQQRALALPLRTQTCLCETPEAHPDNPKENKGKISYEALQGHGLQEASVLDVPDPLAAERERIAAAKEAAKEAAAADSPADVPLIKNAFGKETHDSRLKAQGLKA